MIDPLKPLLVMPEVVDGSKWKTGKVWFADPEERFVVRPFSSVATLLFINTDHVKPDEMRILQGSAQSQVERQNFHAKIRRPPVPAPTWRRVSIHRSARTS